MNVRKVSHSQPMFFSSYHLEVRLAGTEPAVWRRLLVRGDISLGLLHAVIQVAMGWTNSHLHHFLVGRERFSDPTINPEPEFQDEVPDRDERQVTLQEVAPIENARFIYEYDFGDSWQHLVTVEEIGYAKGSSAPFAKCLGGARACPPEDCGGPWGYANLLKVIKNPRHKEYRSMTAWLGTGFDPEAFDLNKVNRYLKKLRWPQMTVTQLARVLMERDDYRERG